MFGRIEVFVWGGSVRMGVMSFFNRKSVIFNYFIMKVINCSFSYFGSNYFDEVKVMGFVSVGIFYDLVFFDFVIFFE